MADQQRSHDARAPEFYIGYRTLPEGHRSLFRAVVPAMLWLMAALAALMAARMRDAGPAKWDASDRRIFTGRLDVSPYPVLRLATGPGAAAGAAGSYLLVEAGKLGGRAGLEDMDGAMVRVSGSLLQRDGRRMIELAPGPGAVVVTHSAQAAPAEREAMGTVTLRGEIVDSKCFLGAMRPGDGKTHRACAQLCIAGGIPPMLVTRGAGGRYEFFLLTTSVGAPAGDTSAGAPAGDAVRPFVAEAVEVTGRLHRLDDLLVLRVDEGGIRRF